MKLREMCRAGVLTAVVFAVTRFIQIPIPLGYFNVGNVVILLSCLFLSVPYGVFVGGVGSALADLLSSYPVYTLPTLVIKSVMPLIFYGLTRGKPGKGRSILAAAVATLLPLIGYTVTGAVLYGGFAVGMQQFPGLLLEYAANLILFALLYPQFARLQRGK